ncbi:hypothetical protein PVL29_023955 [Vitis rotundifolia]|uniref:RING-type E3 ubiquitin transferase n=1 Tax=Vitis rotundifolia TaxID=103349 RepID=A0AA38YQJ0_VITRO|nr:hypothetical protein PVL29_023955 [Vitis rotundifolia]
MGSDTDVVELPYYCTIKVHRLICLKLKSYIDRISQIFSALESARPRCGTGMQALCSLHHAMDKAKLLIQNCTESSKLYLAITADKIVLRCERICNCLESSLRQLQNNVPTLLAAKISGIVEDLKGAKFTVESADDEAGRVVLAVVRQGMPDSESINISELEAIQIAASRLNIASHMALLIEKRSIKRLIDKVPDTNLTKMKILKYLLYLLRKYGELIGGRNTESTTMYQSIEQEPHEESAIYETLADDFSVTNPPEEFKCPISMRLMYDPVVIASGQTYERFWITKWFNDGNDTCPKTHEKLSQFFLTPNSTMKNLISRWCLKHGISISNPCSQQAPASLPLQKLSSSSSIASFASSLNGLCLQTSSVSLHSTDTNFPSNKLDVRMDNGSAHELPQMNADSQGCQSSANRHGMNFAFLSKLAALPWESQCKEIGNVRDQLEDSIQACHSTFSSSYIKPLIRFLKDARENGNLQAQRDGALVLLYFLNKRRSEMPPLHEDAIYVLASFLDSEITEEALAIMEVLSCQRHYKSEIVASGVLPSIIKFLDTKMKKFHVLALKILSNLSPNHDIGHHIVYLDCIPKLAPFLVDHNLARYCIKIFRNLCDIEEARITVAETNQCIDFIAEILENGSEEEQEDALEVLLSLYHYREEYGLLFRKDHIVQSLFHISLNGNARGQEIAKELLQLLRHIKNDPILECSSSCSTSNEVIQDFVINSKGKKLPLKASRILGKKISRFRKPRS